MMDVFGAYGGKSFKELKQLRTLAGQLAYHEVVMFLRSVLSGTMALEGPKSTFETENLASGYKGVMI